MAQKKKRTKMKEEIQQTDRTIQYVAAAVIALVVLALAWQYIPKGQSGANANATAVPTEAAAINDGFPPPASSPPVAIEATATDSAPLDIGEATACADFDSIAAATKYAEAPPMKVDATKQYFGTFKMAKGGEFIVELYPAKSPITVNSFVFLACKKFFDGVTFHRVLEGFMAQGGDPDGTGMGGPGYQFVNENSDLTFDKAGVLAMANAGPDTNGSQFFITFGPTPNLNGGYTIFGQVVKGMDVVNGITRRDPSANPSFTGDVIESISITMK